MINIKELEKRWIRYKTKSFLLLSSIIAITISLIYGGYYILYKLDISVKKEDSSIIKRDEINSTNSTATIVKTDTKNTTTLSLTPTIPIIDDTPINNRPTKKIKTKEIKRVVDKPHKRVVKKRVKKIEKEHKKEESRKRIDFKKSSSNYMRIMKDKFNRNKNPREALLIAKAYYRAGNYNKSEEWALKANSLDRNSEESWLLFAKSKNLLGNHREALKILIAYYNKTKSPKAKILIDKISSESKK